MGKPGSCNGCEGRPQRGGRVGVAGPGPAGRGDDGVGSPGAALHHLPQPRRPGPQARHQGPGEGVDS